MRRAPSIGLAIATLALVALFLRYGVPVIGRLVQGHGAVAGEAIFTGLVFAPMLALGMAGGALAGVRALRLGAQPFRGLVGGGAVGALALALAAGYCALAGTLVSQRSPTAGASLLVGLTVVVIQVAGEEVLFRGFLQPLLVGAVGTAAGILLTAASFAGLHLAGGAEGGVALANMMLGGILFGCLAQQGKGIAAATGAHLSWNAGEQLVLGLDPNPGIGGFGSLFDLDLAGPAAWGGSGAGLNNSWAMSFALAAAITYVLVALRPVAAATPPTIGPAVRAGR